jgi:DNA polymerase
MQFDLLFRIYKCDICGNWRKALPDGDLKKAKVFILGESPGAEELKTGICFSGRSGDLVRGVLSRLNVDFYLTNRVKCEWEAKEGNKEKLCLRWLKEELKEAASVNKVIALSQASLRGLMDYDTPTDKVWGLKKLGKEIYYVPHPAFYLRQGKAEEFKRKFKEAILS